MKQLNIAIKKSMLDGEMIPADLDLRTFAPVVIVGAAIPKPARLVICESSSFRDRLIRDSYQMNDLAPAGVLFELASNVIWHNFDFNLRLDQLPDDCLRLNRNTDCYYSKWLVYPQRYAPVTVQSRTGKLACLVEARHGNAKHKAHIEITLNIK